MIISHKNKYLFVELPFTGSTAISAELCENYDGISILKKHSRYHEFLQVAEEKEKNYFVFSCIRNPMDAVVSAFYKKKYNHGDRFTTKTEWKKYGGSLSNKDLRIYNDIKKNNMEFVDYFKKYFHLPYDNWSRLAHKEFDFIIKFENIESDFEKVLSLMNLKMKRPLPVKNKTVSKNVRYIDLFIPEIRKRAVNIFGPFMIDWDYKFPEDWNENEPSKFYTTAYRFLGALKYYYWRYTAKSTKNQRKEYRLNKDSNYNSFRR
ncbi:MAG: hypothetical protein Kow0098_14160 [Ignavibacteriaceae bacterium]